MRKNLTRSILVLAVVGGTCFLCFASDTKSFTVKANIPTVNPSFDITFYQITPSADCTSDSWGPGSSTSSLLDFGTLQWDSKYKIFRGQYYGAVDVGVRDNTGTNWTITHTVTYFSHTTNPTYDLNNNVNVSFNKCVDDCKDPGEQIELAKVSYFPGSNGMQFTKSQLSGGWLRIYYGIATGLKQDSGACKRDAPEVVPVTADKPAGQYQGRVTLTLTP
jgi:hypothetical protein